MTWTWIFLSILSSSIIAKATSEKDIKEAQQKILVFLKEPSGINWLSSVSQERRSPLKTIELLSAIIDPTSPASAETKSAATELKSALDTGTNATQIELEGWKDLIDNGPQDDIICLYRALNTTSNRTEDWQKFLTNISDGYMIYLALDMGTKTLICMKKIPIQTRVLDTSTQEPSTLSTSESPESKMGNGSRALNDPLPLQEDSCEDSKESNTRNSRRQFSEPKPQPPPCNRPIIYVLPVNYPGQNGYVPWQQRHLPQAYPSQQIGPYPISNSQFNPNQQMNSLIPNRRSPYNADPLNAIDGPNKPNKLNGPLPSSPGGFAYRPAPRNWQPPISCDQNNWQPECFWKPPQRYPNLGPLRPTMVDNNFGYRKTLPVEQSPSSKESAAVQRRLVPMKKVLPNWRHPNRNFMDPPIVPYVIYNRYSLRYPPGWPVGQNMPVGPNWQNRNALEEPNKGGLEGPNTPVEPGPNEVAKQNRPCASKNCLCSLCDKPIVVKVLLENSAKKEEATGSRRSLDLQEVADAIGKTDQSLEELEKKVKEELAGTKKGNEDTEIEESKESSED
ncbi:uncharacterized protein LOC130668292 [Microplitis mediator]|uniref:uncharacterized protein LOC130668292 n=1 Tax=Microplitis mediator TaxID=375433 RepID=UPI0025577F75|nr:uncharacterized protein LOC130668292 [Microplitis mediator]XP_057326509.1 uncharacterized protein LOC130668292 [Microplitis mediator]XP_057326518.1 uncharacterized protein LOC130668292 [Microplitis mediator]